MRSKVTAISEHDHWADYAELTITPRERRHFNAAFLLTLVMGTVAWVSFAYFAIWFCLNASQIWNRWLDSVLGSVK